MIFGYEKLNLPYTFVANSEWRLNGKINWYHDISTENKLWGRFGKDSLYYYLDIPDIGIARLHKKNHLVEFVNLKNLDKEQVESFYLHHLLPLLLSLEGKTVLHSGAFLIDNTAYLYLGPSGIGKSTLSLQLLNLNQPILGDDALLLNCKNQNSYVYTGTKTLRFQQDLPSYLTKNLKVKGSYFNKLVIHLEDHFKLLPSYKVGALLFLETGPKICIQKTKPLEAFPQLLSHTFRLETENPQLLKNEVIRLNDLISHTPCYKVLWPKKFVELEENTRLLLDYFQRVLLDSINKN
ncbi:MAG: hypothetical protein H6625_10055 [Bdellovibrionaceae bacterium]|nr:hypothetical protein [Pseudobdellovibrionaceae bacterium]